MSKPFDVQILVTLFNQCFESSLRTRLVPGAEEPLYQPAQDASDVHRIYSTRDYFASALHEISHWCIAGEARRLLVDFGYWYEPDGRDAEQQAEFERVEVKPQALEWLFSRCCGFPFKLSVDNLHRPEEQASPVFKDAVVAQVHGYLCGALNSRAQQFALACGQFYHGPQWSLEELSPADFALSWL